MMLGIPPFLLSWMRKYADALRYTRFFGISILILAVLLIGIQILVIQNPDLENIFYLFPDNPSLSSFYLANYVHDQANLLRHLGGNILIMVLTGFGIIGTGFLMRNRTKWAESLKICYFSLLTFLLCFSVLIFYPLYLTLAGTSDNMPVGGFSGTVCALIGLGCFFRYRSCSEKLPDIKENRYRLLLPFLAPVLFAGFICIFPNILPHIEGYVLGYLTAWVYDTIFNSKNRHKITLCVFLLIGLVVPTLIWLTIVFLRMLGVI